MQTTTITFVNNTASPTSDQILLFLQPVGPQANYVYSAWDSLNPSIGSLQDVELTTTFSASIAPLGSDHDDHSSPAELSLGTVSEVINPNNQSPFIGGTTDQSSITPTSDQVAVYNNTLIPPLNLSVTWLVNGKQVVQTNNTDTTALKPGDTATFQLQQSIYCMLGQIPQVEPTWTAESVGKMVTFPIPNASELSIEVYTGTDGRNSFRIATPDVVAVARKKAAQSIAA